MPFSGDSHLYIGQLRMKHQKWHWVSDILAFPHIYRIIHTNWGKSYFQYLCHPLYNPRTIQFHSYPFTPFFFPPYQDKQSLTQISSFPMYIQTGPIAKPISLCEESFTLPLLSFEPGCLYPPSLKPT